MEISKLPRATANVIDTVATSLGSTYDKLDSFSRCIIPEDKGIGHIDQTFIRPGLFTIDIDVTLHSALKIPLYAIAKNSFQFFYVLNGSVTHFAESTLKKHTIDSFQTAIAHANDTEISYIGIPADTAVKMNILLLDRELFFDKYSDTQNTYEDNLAKLTEHLKNPEAPFTMGTLNLKIAEQLKFTHKAVFANQYSQQIARNARYNLALAMHLEQYYISIELTKNTSKLLRRELNEISLLSDFIKEKPEVQHSLRSLCLQSGLSPAKLQEGFKFMYDRTVSDFVRNVRLDKAEVLIRTTDLSISEIVYSIGLTSRSYFCKIFKKRYKRSPKEYRAKHA